LNAQHVSKEFQVIFKIELIGLIFVWFSICLLDLHLIEYKNDYMMSGINSF